LPTSTASRLEAASNTRVSPVAARIDAGAGLTLSRPGLGLAPAADPLLLPAVTAPAADAGVGATVVLVLLIIVVIFVLLSMGAVELVRFPAAASREGLGLGPLPPGQVDGELLDGLMRGWGVTGKATPARMGGPLSGAVLGPSIEGAGAGAGLGACSSIRPPRRLGMPATPVQQTARAHAA
jgi:hypothetical protein